MAFWDKLLGKKKEKEDAVESSYPVIEELNLFDIQVRDEMTVLEQQVGAFGSRVMDGFLKEAREGDCDAKYALALMYMDGIGCSRSESKAERYLCFVQEHSEDEKQRELAEYLLEKLKN